MFGEQPAFLAVRHALAWLVVLLLPQGRCVQAICWSRKTSRDLTGPTPPHTRSNCTA
jgi:hypothetical protein